MKIDKKLKLFITAGLIMAIAGLCLSSKQKNTQPAQSVSSVNMQISSPSALLAIWLIREGYLNLRAGKIDDAAKASDLALFIDEEAQSKPLIDAVNESRKHILMVKSAEAGDAKAAGNMAKFARAKSVIERVKDEGN